MLTSNSRNNRNQKRGPRASFCLPASGLATAAALGKVRPWRRTGSSQPVAVLELCERKGVIIHEANACKDYIHMLVSIPPKLSVSSFMGYLKGKSSLMIFDRYANLKYRYGNRKFWCRGYFVDTVGRNKEKIEEYIRNQVREDQVAEQLSLFEAADPFTGEKYRRK